MPAADKASSVSRDELPPQQQSRLSSTLFQIASFDRPKALHKRKVVTLIRNGERMDRVFPEWLNLNFTDAGEYLPTDLNQPVEMLQRSGGIGDFVNDSPITEIGGLTGQILGRSFRLYDLWPLQHIYCSPALRCVQTAAAFIKGLNKPIQMCIEPALFDWGKWYKQLPAFMSSEELAKAGFPVDTTYQSLLKPEDLGTLMGQESLDDFYARIARCMQSLVGVPDPDRVAIFAHATSIDACIKALRRCLPRAITDFDMTHMGLHYPYGTVVALAQDRENWSFVHQPIAHMSYLGVSNKPDVKFINQTTRATFNGKYEI